MNLRRNDGMTEGRNDGMVMKWWLILAVFVSVLPSYRRCTAQAVPDPYRARALAILKTVPLIEGHNAIENSLGALRMFARLGVRYMTLTHWRTLDWAVASTDSSHRGLSDFGRQVVLEMNRVGMLVDLSHVNDQTMSDAIHMSR